MWIAAQNGHSQIVDMLLRHGALDDDKLVRNLHFFHIKKTKCYTNIFSQEPHGDDCTYEVNSKRPL